MLNKLGFRNIFRNKRRSIITCMIMGLGLAALIFADAFLHGLNENMITSVTDSFIGDGQIHQKNYIKTRELEKTINDSEIILKSLTENPKIKTAVPRVISSAMIASPTDILPILLYGIDQEKETKISSLSQSIIKGEYLKNSDTMELLIGEKLAKFLGVDVGDKVVITLSQAKTGTLSQEMFRVSGIFKMKNKEMDTNMAFINIKRGQEIMAIGDNFHEIVIKFTHKNDLLNPPADLLKEYSIHENELLSWKKLVPAIDAGIQLTNYSLYIGSFILFAIIALSTMNTLFMSLFERMYEFGIMKAIGTRPAFIFKLIIVEAFALALFSTLLGIIIGGLATLITNYTGISHLTDVEYLGTTIKSAIRPIPSILQYTAYPAAIFIFAILSSIYPAINAARIIPSKSMRRD
jgi:ABC-type lipoprotein release transport system permease subunit